MKSILDPAFRYIPSIETDVRKTFDRIRRERREQSRTTSSRGAGTNVQQLRAVTNGMRPVVERAIFGVHREHNRLDFLGVWGGRPEKRTG